ncbi:MAG: hypothetical protein AB7O57_15325 [Hyphomicrobiaceae bacterium]
MTTGEIIERVWRSVVPRGSDIVPLLLPVEWERQVVTVAPGLDRTETDRVLAGIETKLAANVTDMEIDE